jgi:hypothetical protein
MEAWARTANFPKADNGGLRAAHEVDSWVQANRPQSWTVAAPAKKTVAAKKTASAKKASRPAPRTESASSASSTPATEPATPRRRPAKKTAPAKKTVVQQGIDRAGIAERFGVSVGTVGNQYWTGQREKKDDRGKVVRDAFPAQISPGRWAVEEVDTWVKRNRPHVWAGFAGAGTVLLQPLPEGNPLDLLDLMDFAAVWGNATRGNPLAYNTMKAYGSRGQIPPPDRRPDDGKAPRVRSPHWFRRTVNDFVLSRHGSGRFGARSEEGQQ